MSDDRSVTGKFGLLEWVALIEEQGIEHYIAESGWMLARVQRGPNCKGWLWSVNTHRHVISRGKFYDGDELEDAKNACEAIVAGAYNQ